jgi:predicted ArsR family transcriptional regulator
METLPYLERVKIQCEILLPLYRQLRTALGEARAAELLRAAVREYAQGLGQAVAGSQQGTSLQKLKSMLPAFAAADALSFETRVDDANSLSFDVHRCAYAQYFQALGEPAFGAIVTCEIDPPMTRAIGADLTLARTQTIMGGASHCDFRFASEP